MNKILYTLIIAGFFLCADVAHATSPGTAGAQFLNIGISARPSAMGETSATLQGASALFYNPAGITSVINTEITASQVNWIQDIGYSNLCIAKTINNGTLAFGANYLYVPPIRKIDNTGTTLDESYTVNDMAISVGYAYECTPHLRIGTLLRRITCRLEEYTATAIAGDAGIQYEFGSTPLMFGIVAQNVGTALTFINESAPLPLNYKAGAAYTFAITPSGGAFGDSYFGKNTLTLAADANLSQEIGFYANGGLEYCIRFSPTWTVKLRGGYRSDLNEKVNGFSLGLGLESNSYSVDYAYSGLGDLGMAHRLSLSYRIGLH